MKLLTTLFCSLFIGLTIQSATAQQLTEGTVNYEIKAEGSDPQLAMINGSTIALAFKKDLSKLTANIMGGMIAMNMVMDGAAKEGLVLMDMMAQKKAIKMDKSSFDKNKAKAEKANIEMTNETKTIAGYVCKKGTITNPDGQKITLYICKELKAPKNHFIEQLTGSLDGFPLGVEVKTEMANIKIMATEVLKKAPAKKEFSMKVPEGYEITSPDELGGMFGR